MYNLIYKQYALTVLKGTMFIKPSIYLYIYLYAKSFYFNQ